ncbi:MAG: aminotransferase class V-fold PLP-dependent enzyme, partial [Flavobacteriaceae bacterium]|nr:aminotransferase class V-fold PLP-dependent enzyme [Flavobacteriaceae bacterium]
IIVSCQDHEANAGAWRRLAKRGIKVIEWHVDKERGMLDVQVLKSLFTDRTKMVAFPHCSNVIGYINPVKEISKLAHEHGALSVVDGVGWAPHGLPDLQDLRADIYMFSTYKTYGPHLGVMYVNQDLMGKLENQSHFFKDGNPKGMITPAGPDHGQIATINGILDYFDTLYEHHFKDDAKPAERNRALNRLFREHEVALQETLLNFLNSRDDVRIVGPEANLNRAPIIAIMPLEKSIKRVYAGLIKQQLMLGIGDFYAVRPLMDMGIPIDPGVIRMSFVHYTTEEEIQQLITVLEAVL